MCSLNYAYMSTCKKRKRRRKKVFFDNLQDCETQGLFRFSQPVEVEDYGLVPITVVK